MLDHAVPRTVRRIALGFALLAPLGSALVRAQATRPAAPALTELRSLDQFRTQFNEDVGVPRVVLLLSPT